MIEEPGAPAAGGAFEAAVDGLLAHPQDDLEPFGCPQAILIVSAEV
jgi:hypothetical protein